MTQHWQKGFTDPKKIIEEQIAPLWAEALEITPMVYWSSDGTEHEAFQISWEDVEGILGHKHAGSPEDDRVLVGYMRQHGAPDWIENAEGWVDEYGWGVIGPVKQIATYKVVMRDNPDSFTVAAIAETIDGTWRDCVKRFDGEHDMGFIDLPAEDAEQLERILEEDDNVISYRRD